MAKVSETKYEKYNLGEINNKNMSMNGDRIFIIEICKDAIVGTVRIKSEKKFKILALERVLYKKEAIVDGKIYDVVEVKKSVAILKRNLENKTKTKIINPMIITSLIELKKFENILEKKFDSSYEVTQEKLDLLKVEALSSSIQKLDSIVDENEKSFFTCVGYNINNYYLNDFPVISLIGNKSKRFSINISTTYVSYLIIDSLFTAMKSIGLDIHSVWIQEDKAENDFVNIDSNVLEFTNSNYDKKTNGVIEAENGFIFKYNEISSIGDKITEEISKYCNIDYTEAEKIKISLNKKNYRIPFIGEGGKSKSISSSKLRDYLRGQNFITPKIIIHNSYDYAQKRNGKALLEASINVNEENYEIEELNFKLN